MIVDAPSPDRLEQGRLALGSRLRQLREAAGLTLGQTGAASALSVSYLSDVERGRRLPTLDALDRVCVALGVLVVDALQDVYPYGSAVRGADARPLPDGRSRARRA